MGVPFLDTDPPPPQVLETSHVTGEINKVTRITSTMIFVDVPACHAATPSTISICMTGRWEISTEFGGFLDGVSLFLDEGPPDARPSHQGKLWNNKKISLFSVKYISNCRRFIAVIAGKFTGCYGACTTHRTKISLF